MRTRRPAGGLVDLIVDLSIDGFIVGLNADRSTGNTSTSVSTQLIIHCDSLDQVLFEASAVIDPFAPLDASQFSGDWLTSDFTNLVDLPSSDLDDLTALLLLSAGGYLLDGFASSFQTQVGVDETISIELVLETGATGGGPGFQATVVGFADTGAFELSTITPRVTIQQEQAASAVVPEPLRFVLCAIGAGALLIARRRRKRQP